MCIIYKMRKQSFITRTSDYHPMKNKKYFQLDEANDCLAVVMPFYNEEADELKKGLISLYYTHKYLTIRSPEWENRKMKVLLIQDGWYKSSDSMKEYLKELFNSYKWWETNKEFTEFDVEKDGNVTFILENNYDICINQKEVSNGELKKCLDLTLIIKMDNRKKHNSHEWFMGHNGFAEAMKSKYMFCTDAFTLYQKSCLYHLVKYMDLNDNVSVATGRQRVMTKEQQGSNECMFSFENWMRLIQLFDFESSNALYNGAYAFAGFLPVVPGPCGLYRSIDLLNDNVRYWYFDVVNKDPSETGMILGNLKIAEDRILSYAATLKTDVEKKMAFVPLSVFYFEAETNLKQFLLQRRRWINGSMAGYFYLLVNHPKILFSWNAGFLRKCYVIIMLICQFFTYILIAVSPAFVISMFKYALRYLLDIFLTEDYSYYISTGAVIIYMILYILHILYHHYHQYTVLIPIMVTLSSFTSLLTLTSITTYFIRERDILFDGSQTQDTIYLIISLCTMLLPIINSVLISGRFHSLWYMIKSALPYFIFLPTLVSVFGSYSYSRTWDMTWGNRPNANHEKDEKNKEFFKFQSKIIIMIIIIICIFTYSIPTNFSIYILFFIFSLIILQSLLSFVYLITFIPTKLKYVYEKCRVNVTMKMIDQKDIEQNQSNEIIEEDNI